MGSEAAQIVVCGPRDGLAGRWVNALVDEPVEWLKPDDPFVRIIPSRLLLFGNLAVMRFTRHSVNEIRGRWFRAGESWAMATWHPWQVLQNRSLEIDVIEDLRLFVDLPPYIFYPCLRCGGTSDSHIDEEGISWCGNHWEERVRTVGGQEMTGQTLSELRRQSRVRKKQNKLAQIPLL